MRKNVSLSFLAAALLALPTLANTPERLYGELITSGPRDSQKMALTFDDGPGPQTEEFLKLLDRYQVKATFFVLGELVGFRKKIVQDIHQQGHQIGDHSYTHLNYLVELKKIKETLPEGSDLEAISHVKMKLSSDLQKSRNLIESAIGDTIHLCRMPHGVDRPWIKEVASNLKYVLVNWTYGADWTTQSYDELEAAYRKAVRPGAILLFHDGGTKREQTLKLTEAVIQEAQIKGLKLVTVDDLLGFSPPPHPTRP